MCNAYLQSLCCMQFLIAMLIFVICDSSIWSALQQETPVRVLQMTFKTRSLTAGPTCNGGNGMGA